MPSVTGKGHLLNYARDTAIWQYIPGGTPSHLHWGSRLKCSPTAVPSISYSMHRLSGVRYLTFYSVFIAARDTYAVHFPNVPPAPLSPSDSRPKLRHHNFLSAPNSEQHSALSSISPERRNRLTDWVPNLLRYSQRDTVPSFYTHPFNSTFSHLHSISPHHEPV